MIRSKEMTELSKTLSRVLRHEPWLFEVELDDNGWVDLDQVILSLRLEKDSWRSLSVEDIEASIRGSTKQRHEIHDGKIRALYGHSVLGKITKEKAEPPPLLFHGTTEEALDTIRRSGILPMQRQYVHLSTGLDDAVAVARRKTKTPVILKIEAASAWKNGTAFYRGNEKVWLADRVMPEFIKTHGAESDKPAI